MDIIFHNKTKTIIDHWESNWADRQPVKAAHCEFNSKQWTNINTNLYLPSNSIKRKNENKINNAQITTCKHQRKKDAKATAPSEYRYIDNENRADIIVGYAICGIYSFRISDVAFLFFLLSLFSPSIYLTISHSKDQPWNFIHWFQAHPYFIQIALSIATQQYGKGKHIKSNLIVCKIKPFS